MKDGFGRLVNEVHLVLISLHMHPTLTINHKYFQIIDNNGRHSINVVTRLSATSIWIKIH